MAKDETFALNATTKKTGDVKEGYPASPDGQNPPSGPDPDPDGEAKTVIANLPAGFLGNPQAVPRCEQRDFPPPSFGGYSRCAPASQVGIASLDLGQISGYPYPPGAFKVPVYNLTPPKGVVARLGFVEVSLVVIDITLRTGSDYGITATIRNLSEAPNIYGSSVTLWGVPADSSHDAERYRSGQSIPGDASGQPLPSGLPLTPFLTNPAQCDVPVTAGVSVASWQDPEKFLSYTSVPTPYTGCDRLTLKSSLEVTPTSAGAGEPTGIAVDLNVDQPQAPTALGSPPLKKVVMTLPEGCGVAVVGGRSGCVPTGPDRPRTNDAPACPDSARSSGRCRSTRRCCPIR